jgi:L-histidine N-alpha-methyltransferase
VTLPEHDELTPVGERFSLYRAPQTAFVASFADDVRSGLTSEPKHLAPKYFYDDLGSALFEAICELPEYYLTRAETQILERYAAEMVTALSGPIELVEFGSGSARKTRVLVSAALDAQDALDYHPIDISSSALVASASTLAQAFDRLTVTAYASDYVEVLASARLRTSKRVLAMFLGSNIGNYQPDDAAALLSAMSASFKPGDGLLLGTDLKKDTATLERAYNDPTGVTAAFDKNLLARINRELGGGFDLDAFSFAARYSYLVAQRGMTVPIADLGMHVRFVPAETIHMESSFKFDANDVARLARRSGFRVERVWTDDENRFAVSLLVIEPV